MKKILKTLLFCCLAAAIIAGCKKNEFSDIGEGTVEAKEYVFNRATKTFDLGDEIKSHITAAEGVKFVYCYLVREDQTDLLIHVTDNKGVVSPTYDLSIPIDEFPVDEMSAVKGVKILVKQGDNSSLEGFIPIAYFDPALPQFSAFPATINADLNGGTSAFTATIKSEFGIKQVDILDDFQTENTYVLVNSITDINSLKEYVLNYAYTYRKAAQHIKIRATDIYNQTNEIIINMPVDVSIFKPNFNNFPALIETTATNIAGEITSITGLKKVEIYDDRNGAYELLGTADNLGGVISYNYSSSYAFKKRAANIKIIAVDTEDLQAELIIPINITYQSVVYRDVEMNAQTLGTKTGLLYSGSTIGNCELMANEANIITIFYATGNGPTLYNPVNATTGSFPAQLRCSANGNAGWTINNPAALHDTKFRVLIDGASTGQSAAYDILEANEVDDLSDTFFSSKSISAPGSSGPRLQSQTDPAPSASIFNLTTGRLIYARITDRTTNTYKNALIHVKACVFEAVGGNSTIKFDIYIQK